MIAFADTSGLASFVDKTQFWHASASDILRGRRAQGGKFITTNYVLAELTALFNKPMRIPRPKQQEFFRGLRAVPWMEIVHIDAALDAAAWHLWETRPDKEWSLVDCASFVVMEQRGLIEAYTADHHFEQAGFVRLLK